MIKWLKLLSTFKLPANYFKIDGSVKAEPSSQGTQVLRLDENAVLIDTQLQGHPMLAAMMPWMVVGIVFSCYVLVTGVNDLLFPLPSNEPPADLLSHIANWMLLLGGVPPCNLLLARLHGPHPTLSLPSPARPQGPQGLRLLPWKPG